MLAAMDYTKQKSGTIFTLNQTDELEFDKKTIFVKPVWKWLMDT
jgi:hypothetical protein